MYREHRVAVAIPAHNEERLIARTLEAVPSYVDLVVAVDDASDDATAREIARVAARSPRVHPIYRRRNGGVGAAIVTAYRAALAHGADVVAVMDGDGQMDPRDLAAMLDPICAGRADMTKGNRFDGLAPRGAMPATRHIGNVVLSAATRLVAGWRAPLDAQCGYTALSSTAIARLPLDDLFPRYGFPNDIFLRALEADLRVESIPIRAVYGAEVSGIRPHVAIPRIFGLLVSAAVRRTAIGVARNRPRALEADEQS